MQYFKLSAQSPSIVLALGHVIPVEVGPAPVSGLLSDHQETQEDILKYVSRDNVTRARRGHSP